MEIVGSFLDEEWESLSQMFSIGENPNFLLHCEGSNLFPSNVEIPSYQAFNISQESSNTNEIEEALFLNIQDHNTTDFFSDDVMEEFLRLKSETRAPETCQEVQLKRKYETQIQDQDQSEDYSPQIINPKKKPRFSRNTKRSKKKIEEKKNEEDNNSTGGSYSSEDESVKTRAGRGSASLYARKRRERINERLRILQNLVPNGTKVDISTMLEEAVQYVKFLQLQIKLLSSDNLWMYAPLAYNGMDISMYHKICPNLML